MLDSGLAFLSPSGPMWPFTSRLPDSERQRRWEARQQARVAHRHEPGTPVLGAGARRLVGLLAVACVVALVVLAVSRA